MKSILIFYLLLTMLIVQTVSGQPLSPSTQPNPTQNQMIKRGYGMFIHFGVNTFADMEWSDGSIPVEKYNPTNLDCDQWIRVARDAGFRYVLLITKHHDGFCLWDSKYTNYDVAASPVKTDIVAEVSKACRKYGLEFAVYYSLWDRKDLSYQDKNPEKYIDYMCNQLTELLTNYGPICELWLDGGWDRKVDDWNLPRVYNLIKKLQPNCAVGVNHTIVLQEKERKFALPDSMTVDNKYYFQYFPSDFRLWDPKIAHKSDKKQYLYEGQSYYLPFEHTICISKAWTWFQKQQPQPVRDLDELEELFYWCTDNNNTLVVNVPPDQTGRIREHEANTVIELGKRLGIRKDQPLPRNGKFISIKAPATASSTYGNDEAKHGATFAVDGGMQTRWASADTLATLTIQLNEAEAFNKISIFEYCDELYGKDGFTNTRTNRIQAYNISILQNGQWTPIYSDNQPMGDCKVIRFPKSYHTSQIRLEVTKAIAPPSIYEFNVIRTNAPQQILPVPSTLPNSAQQKQINRKYGMFIHFGINTFHDEEWTDGSKPASSYCPRKIDAEQWIKAAKDAGMKYVILISKHHDGFCLWDSKYTEYDVANSGNKTDVIEAVAKACQKYNIGLGLYYSLWDRKVNGNTEDRSQDETYNTYMLGQIKELIDIVQKHTHLVEFWFDGGWTKENYRWPVNELYQLIKSNEPECQVGINWSIGLPENPDAHPVLPQDQKKGFPIRYFPSDFRLGDPYLPLPNDPKIFTHEGKEYYMPWESTICISDRWFYNTQDTNFKSVEKLAELYKRCTQTDNILILNCPPNRDGQLRKTDIKLLKELRKQLHF